MALLTYYSLRYLAIQINKEQIFRLRFSFRMFSLTFVERKQKKRPDTYRDALKSLPDDRQVKILRALCSDENQLSKFVNAAIFRFCHSS